MTKAVLYLRTVRHLKFRQIFFRLLRRLRKPRLPQRPAPATPRPGVSLGAPLTRPRGGAHDFAFRFLNREIVLSPRRVDWKPAGADRLWRYNLQYFDYLHDAGRSHESGKILIDSWIAANPPGATDAWDPFPLSLRIVNWIKYFLASESPPSARWLESLYSQALWLEQSVEYHLLANHYFKNGKALVFAGLYFSGRDAERWLRKGLEIVSRELAEQILPDGGHFERSPMYHAMILEDCLDLLNLCDGRPEGEVGQLCEQLRGVVPPMLRFLTAMTHPDGEIALFNDAAIGIEAPPRLLVAYWERLSGTRFVHNRERTAGFPATGYFVMAPGEDDRLIVDCGPVGPSYQPGHAHCDTLSFELSLGGRRVIVDSGCGRYQAGEVRSYQRGNAGHNTLTIDERNQSEVWGAHRLARRAGPLSPSLELLPDGTLSFTGGHDGYRRLPGSPLHRRTISWRERTIRVLDAVSGEGRHLVESRLHLHPDCRLTREGTGFAVTVDGVALFHVSRIDAGAVHARSGRYSPGFGIFHDCPLLVAVHSARLPHLGGWIIERAP